DEDPRVGEVATCALGELGDNRAVEPLIAYLEHAESCRRSSAVRALGRLGDARAAGPLLLCLHDPDVGVGRAAAEALLHPGTVQLVEPVLAWIRTHEQGVYVVEKALTYTGDRRVADLLIARLQEQESDVVRGATIQALLWEGDVTALEPLVAC